MADRTKRYYSVRVLPEAPGGIHHPDCPCCRTRERVEAACRSAYGMRGAGFSDRIIAVALRNEGYDRFHTEVALQFVRTELPPSRIVHHWHDDRQKPT